MKPLSPLIARCLTCGRSLKDRSNRQNAYLWSVVYQIIANETGDSIEKTHHDLKEKFLPRMFVTVGDQEREHDKTTTLLSTSQMETYLTQIRQWASEFLHCFIPLPNEPAFSETQLSSTTKKEIEFDQVQGPKALTGNRDMDVRKVRDTRKDGPRSYQVETFSSDETRPIEYSEEMQEMSRQRTQGSSSQNLSSI